MGRKEVEFEIRDHRKRPFFWADHDFMNRWARVCGPNAALVYMCLCHHEDRNRECTVPISTIVGELALSKSSVIRSLARLEALSIIKTTRAEGRKSIYVLLDSSSWAAEPVSVGHRSKCATGVCGTPVEDEPVSVSDRSGVCETPVSHPPLIQEESLRINTPPLTPPDGGEGVRKLEDSFGRFWAAYPKRKSKARAFKAWMKLKPSEQLVATIIAAIERATTSVQWTKEHGTYIPYPASWINDHAWEDEYQTGEIQGQPADANPLEPPKRRIIKRVDGSLAELVNGEIMPIADPQALSPPPVNGNNGFDVTGFVRDISAALGSRGT